MLLALAHGEPGGRYELDAVATTARRTAAGYVLKGAKSVVLHGGSADRLIVSARTGTAISLFIVPADAPGVARKSYPTRDDQRAADITFDDVALERTALLGEEGQGLPVLERAIDFALAALCAEAVGCMDTLMEHTLEYTKTRKQFGVAIGTFQVLKHRMADMFIAAAQARSMACLAAVRAADPDRAVRRHALSAAKAFIGKAARRVGQEAVQLHGGMGVVDELAVSHYFRRLTAINTLFGDADHHLALFSDALLAEPAEAAEKRAAPKAQAAAAD
jgi:alkylation response protein AidB-like acyl-CoA dehydrogenase